MRLHPLQYVYVDYDAFQSNSDAFTLMGCVYTHFNTFTSITMRFNLITMRLHSWRVLCKETKTKTK